MSYYCEKCKQQREQGCFGPRCPGIPRHANTDALLPPDRTMWQYGQQIDHYNYTAEQMRAAIAAERERCAKLCDSLHHDWRWDDEPDSDSGPRACAAAIRMA
jgi:hypothetical protein